MYAHKKRDSKYMKQNWIELKKEIDKFTFLLGDFNISFTIIDRISRHRINKDVEDLTTLSPTLLD